MYCPSLHKSSRRHLHGMETTAPYAPQRSTSRSRKAEASAEPGTGMGFQCLSQGRVCGTFSRLCLVEEVFVIRALSIALAGLAGVLLTACGGGAATTQVSASIGAKSLPSIKPPAFIPGPFDGQSTARNLALRRPLAVILENYSPDSRPQAGLAAASTVIETLAEGGVTRFMAVYLEHDASKVGPVRSTRIYFDHWAAGLHAILSHVGGNDDAQRQLWLLPKIFNIDENRWEVSLYNTGTPLYWRSQDRVAPHNMYTSTYKLRQYAAGKKENWAYTGAYFLHKAPKPLKARGHSTVLSIAFANPLAPTPISDYGVKYVYNRTSNTYLRYMGGTPHVDANTHQALRPSTVIVMQTGPATSDPYAGITPESIQIPTIGTGTAWYFRDGTLSRGTWQQRNQNSPLEFLDRGGKEAALNPGQTWIEVVPPSSRITWTVR